MYSTSQWLAQRTGKRKPTIDVAEKNQGLYALEPFVVGMKIIANIET